MHGLTIGSESLNFTARRCDHIEPVSDVNAESLCPSP